MELLDKLNTIIGANKKYLNEGDIKTPIEEPINFNPDDIKIPEDDKEKNDLIKNVKSNKFYSTLKAGHQLGKIVKSAVGEEADKKQIGDLDNRDLDKIIKIFNLFNSIDAGSYSNSITKNIGILQLGKQIEALPKNITPFEAGYNFERLLTGLIGVSTASTSGEEGFPHDVKDKNKKIHYSVKITFDEKRNPDFNVLSFIRYYLIENNKAKKILGIKKEYDDEQKMKSFLIAYGKSNDKFLFLKKLIDENQLRNFFLIIFYLKEKNDIVDSFTIKYFNLDGVLKSIANSINNGKINKTTSTWNQTYDITNIDDLPKKMEIIQTKISNNNDAIRSQLYNAIKLTSSIDDYLINVDPKNIKQSNIKNSNAKKLAEKAIKESKLLEWQITKMYKQYIIGDKKDI